MVEMMYKQPKNEKTLKIPKIPSHPIEKSLAIIKFKNKITLIHALNVYGCI